MQSMLLYVIKSVPLFWKEAFLPPLNMSLKRTSPQQHKDMSLSPRHWQAASAPPQALQALPHKGMQLQAGHTEPRYIPFLLPSSQYGDRGRSVHP